MRRKLVISCAIALDPSTSICASKKSDRPLRQKVRSPFIILYEINPQMLGRKISSSQSSLANEWSEIRRNIRGCQ
jgi:hypothetical protein